MTGDIDYNLHDPIGPGGIARQAPLSDRKNRRKKQSPGQKRSGGKKTPDTETKRPIAGQVDRDTDIPETGDSTQNNRDDHEVDYYA